MSLLKPAKYDRKSKVWNKKNVIILALFFSVLAAGASYVNEKRASNISNDIPGWSWILGGKTVLIDAGHGGVDPGAIGLNRTLEKDINLEISKRLQVLFTQAGSNVVMLREDDRDFGTSSKLLQRKREDLAYRIQTAMDTDADIYLSVHSNSFPDQRQHGPQVFYHPDSEEGKKLAECIQASLNKIASKKRAAKSNQSYFILKNTEMVAVTIEIGFLSNAEEEQKLNQTDYQQRLSMAIFEGVGNYLSEGHSVVTDD
ncbi:MAG: N-acetylmuramoyl-L-alanine amidase [Peptococcaceae bacterium]|nr:N-acetylmuramoyl-L-alanine amidase [Peptococcaceae bacterium]